MASFKKPDTSKHMLYIAGIVFAAVLIFVGLFTSVFANDVGQYKASGYAFGSIDDNSDGIGTGLGYVSFGCEGDGGGVCDAPATELFPSGFGVRINTDPESADYGKFFGYAWSTFYGWISFFHNDVASCGAAGGLEIPGDVTSFLNTPGSTVTLDGFARVLNYDQPDWNGCIRFADSDHFDVGASYESRLTTVSDDELALEGWAWGNNLVGWLSFDCPFCDVTFTGLLEEECTEADESEECIEEEEEGDFVADLELYIETVGNSYYNLLIEDPEENYTTTLIPQAFAENVSSCTAGWSSNGNATVLGWGGPVNDPDMNPLVVGDVTQEFSVTVSNFAIGEIIQFTLDCISVDTNTPVSGEAFLAINFPPGSVSIDADPAVIDDGSGESTLSWNFENVNEESCSIEGFVDITPEIPDDGVIPMSPEFAGTIGFESPSPNSPGSDDLFGIVNFPVAFVLSCEDFSGTTLSDIAYITTKELGCTESMEAAGYCSNDISPIFEEF